MAIGLLCEVPGGTQQQYDEIMRELNLGGKLYAGQLYHIAGPMDDGWRVVDVWESREAFDRFFNDKLQRAMQNANLPQPRLSFFPIHNILSERAKTMGQ